MGKKKVIDESRSLWEQSDDTLERWPTHIISIDGEEEDDGDVMLPHEQKHYERLLAQGKKKEATAYYQSVQKAITQEQEHLQRELKAQSSQELERERQEAEAASLRLKAITAQKRKAKDEKWEKKQTKLKARPKVSHRKVVKPVVIASGVDADGIRRTKLAPVPEQKKRKVRMLEYHIEELVLDGTP
ncbi:MAG TPA: hypothetical protein VNX88_19670 [Terriglobales bacterium]|jgi:hypothetical protein|nr:hypothetical protein [Terriglobales bacterium]